MPDATDLYGLAADLLAAAEEALDTLPLIAPAFEGAPERSFVSAGTPALDCCPQLTVHVAAVTEAATAPFGLATGNRDRSGRINHVSLIVTIARCVQGLSQKGMEAPDVIDLDATAQQVDADGWALWNHIWSMWAAGELFTVCGEVFFDGLRALNSDGGCAGWTLAIRVALDGYNDVAPSS